MDIKSIDLNDVIVLDNNKEYIVTGRALYDEVEYLYLINEDEFTMHFVALSRDTVVMLDNKEDKELIKKLMPLFLQSFADKYKNIINE